MASFSVDGPPAPQAFLSYAHTDDKGLDGATTWLKDELETTVHLLTGRPFTIFQDRNDIEFGQNWLASLDDALEQARFLIPILTPSYFTSIWCRDEAEKFIALEKKAKRNDLILPIYFLEAEVLEHPMLRVADRLATSLHKRQPSDWRDPDMQWRENPRIKQKVITLARQIEKAMKRTSPNKRHASPMVPVNAGGVVDERKGPAAEPVDPLSPPNLSYPEPERSHLENANAALRPQRKASFAAGLALGMVLATAATSLSAWKWMMSPEVAGPNPSLDIMATRLAEAEASLAETARSLREPGVMFRDCLDCPKMVIVPAGDFVMGSKAGGGEHDELPAHTVSIARSFAIGAYEVTFAQWDACVAYGGCEHQPSDEGWGQGDPKIRSNLPVINVNWYDAQEYVAWLSKKTGQRYRLPSEAEWEYVARGGADTRYFWGDHALGCQYANGADVTYKRVSDVSSQAVMKCDDGFAFAAPVGSFEPNGFGLYDMAGNVSEWVEDHKSDSYQDVPLDGSVHLDSGKDYNHRAIRGGDWSKRPDSLRSANRLQSERMSRENVNGFRVGRDLSH